MPNPHPKGLHLELLVVLIGSGKMNGRQLREAHEAVHGKKFEGTRFYVAIDRMHEQGLVGKETTQHPEFNMPIVWVWATAKGEQAACNAKQYFLRIFGLEEGDQGVFA